MVQKGLTVVPGGHMSVILVVIIGLSAVGGQERSKYGPEWASFIYIYTKLLALEPSRGP